MLSRTLRSRSAMRAVPSLFRASYSTPSHNAGQVPVNNPNASETTGTPTPSEGSPASSLQESLAKTEELRTAQAPNRKDIWSRSQQPREVAMLGPRFEQTNLSDQPRPYAAIELIHKQPVRWTHDRIVSCDGGGGPLGHPRVFINTDKPQIAWCEYCGNPFANEHNRKAIEAEANPSYPLSPTGDAAEVNESQRITDEPLGQR